jgi:integration host factor subunit alpha
MNTGAFIMSLTKADIVEAVAEQNGYTYKLSFKVVETLLEVIKSTLEAGEDVKVSGFGKFCINEKKERMVWNLAASEVMMLAARKVVTFRCSRKLRDKINR